MTYFWSLKKKLLVFSLALLTLPFLGVGFLKQIENLLVDNLLQSLSEYATSIAFSLQQQPLRTDERPNTQLHNEVRFYVPSLSQAINIDGYREDWLSIAGFTRQFSEQGVTAEVGVARFDDHLYFQLTVTDTTPSYREVNDQFSVSDWVRVSLTDSESRKLELLFAPVAVGQLRPFYLHNDFSDVWVSRAVWQEHNEGYTLEWGMPLNRHWQALAITVSDHDPVTDNRVFLRSFSNQPNPLQWPLASLEQKLASLSLAGGKRIWVLDDQGQVLARHGNLIPDLRFDRVNPLIHFLLAPPLSGFSDPRARAIEISLPEVKSALNGQPAQRLELIPGTETAIALVAVPILQTDDQQGKSRVSGVVMVEETVAAIQMIQREAMNAFVNTSLLILLLVIVTLIVTATRLTHRITRLSRQTSAAVDEYGRVVQVIKPDKGKDEIGELSVNFSRMSVRLKEYHEHMEKLAARLTHELRTPIATVRSSIDNIALSDHSVLREDKAIVNALTHAQQGIERLSNMITRMREAARLEQSILSLSKQPVELVEFIKQYIEATRPLFTNHQLGLSTDLDTCRIDSHPEVIAQLLDKLLSNARDFALPGTCIEVILSSSDGGDFSDQFIPWPEQGDAQSDKDNRWITLAVSNLGPCFTQCNTADLFSSMVSQRDRQYRSSDQAHLGLGLYIVRLIAEYHKGRYFALNRSDARGVVVGIRLPVAGD